MRLAGCGQSLAKGKERSNEIGLSRGRAIHAYEHQAQIGGIAGRPIPQHAIADHPRPHIMGDEEIDDIGRAWPFERNHFRPAGGIAVIIYGHIEPCPRGQFGPRINVAPQCGLGFRRADIGQPLGQAAG